MNEHNILLAQANQTTDSSNADSAWGTTTSSASDTGDAWSGSGDTGSGTADSWLNAPADPTTAHDSGFSFSHLLNNNTDKIEDAINHGLNWIVAHFRPFFQGLRAPIDTTLSTVDALLHSVPSIALIIIFGLLAWQFSTGLIAIGTVISLVVIALLGIWSDAMTTLSLVLTSLVFCIVIGIPLGILLASSDRVQRIARPILDAMQTTPAFVYLVPVVMLFGIGNVPGVIVTIVFALPPLVRLVNLGIRQVRPDLIEASRAYGASGWQLLTKVQLPLAMPSIMAGINQTLMLALSMVVIASMIAVGGLGQMVLRGIGRLDMGLATIGGLGIVILAISLDRITQALGKSQRQITHWWQKGPIGLVYRLTGAKKTPQTVDNSAATASK